MLFGSHVHVWVLAVLGVVNQSVVLDEKFVFGENCGCRSVTWFVCLRSADAYFIPQCLYVELSTDKDECVRTFVLLCDYEILVQPG